MSFVASSLGTAGLSFVSQVQRAKVLEPRVVHIRVNAVAMGQLSIGADGRKRDPYQKPARMQLGLWHFVPGYIPGANILQNSSHDDSLLSHQDEEQRKDATLRAVGWNL